MPASSECGPCVSLGAETLCGVNGDFLLFLGVVVFFAILSTIVMLARLN